MTFIKKLGLIAALGAFLTGCSTHRENMRVNHTCFDAPSSVVIARIEGFDKESNKIAGGYLSIAEDLLGAAVSLELSNAIENINTAPLLDQGYYTPFDKFFAAKHFRVVKDFTPIKRGDLSSHKTNEDTYSPYDWSILQKKHNVDYALVLKPELFGVKRSYFSVIPTGAPTSTATFTLSFIRLRDGKLMAHYNAETEKNVIGEWDAPPAYEALTSSIRTALINSLDDAHEHMFGDDLDMDDELDLK
jgi:hypothetical protein